MRALISTVAISTLVAIGSLAVMHMAIAAEPSGAESSGLEEIIVTATKRDTRLLDTPLSISVLSAGAIEKNRIVDVTDIEKAVPSFVFLHGSGSDNFLSIRGNSTVDDSSGTDQGVVMLVDDVARVSVADLQPQLYDLNRIEVLNGPQGTLFGRNALGGVIAIYTNNPSFKPEATAELGFGSQNLAEVKGMVNVPLIQDRLALRVSATKETAGGYVRDITTGRDLGGHNLWTVLTKLLYTPSDDIRNVFGFDYLSRTGNQPTVLVGTFQPALYPTLPIHSNEDQTAQGNPGNIDQKIWGLTDRLDWKTGIGSVTSIAGYRNNDIDSLLSLTADPGNDYMFQQNEHDHQFTEELRLASPLEQRISWIAGLYFLDSYKSRPLSLLNNIPPGSQFFGIPGEPPSPIDYIIQQNTTTKSYAGFADATYEISSKLSFELGARYTREEKSGHSFVNLANFFAPPTISADYSHSWSAVTPKATLTYKPTSSFMAYTLVSKGFQSGGFNVTGNTAPALAQPFDSAILWNYEAGVKFDGFNHRIQGGISGFLDRYSNLQIIEYNGQVLTNTTSNAGKANINGIEADLAAAPVNWLNLGVRYTYLQSEFTQYEINNGPGVPPTVNTGNQVPFVAPNKVTLSAEIHFQVPGGDYGRLAFGGDYTYRSNMWITAANNDPSFIRDLTGWRGLVNLHALWASHDDHWECELWGKNVKNIRFVAYPVDNTAFFETPAEAGNPKNRLFDVLSPQYRSFGVTLRWRM
jgi:iron complex outermembrane receptor protein